MRRSLAVALPLMLGCLFAAPSRARSQDLPVLDCAGSPASLPMATEGVAYSASILTSTTFALGGMTASNLPPGLALVDRYYVRGTPTAPGTFSIGLKKYYLNGCGKPLPGKPSVDQPNITTMSLETVTLKVRDTHAPTVGSFTVTPASLGAAGGSITLTVQAADNVAVSRIMMTTLHPDGHSGSAFVPMTGGTAVNGTWSISFALGSNATSAPVSYAFTIAASDADGNTAKAGPAKVVVAPAGPPPATGMLRKRP